MRRKRVVRNPRRKAAFSKTEYKRAIKTTGDIGLPVRQIDFHPDGGFSLVIAKSGDDPVTTINEAQLKELI